MNFWDRPVLAIESSCDETAASVVLGRTVLSNAIASQIDLHAEWGGVVPEHAARAHVEAVVPIVAQALADAGSPEVAAVAATNRPGLVGALAVGLTAAKAIAFERDLPIVGVHHIEGHLLSSYARLSDHDQPPPDRHLCLVVSGGHTDLILVEGLGAYRKLAGTIDDAAGEAFDKGARAMGLGYPGGRAVQEAAERGRPRFPLPVGMAKDPAKMSFSGLKTAVLRLVESDPKLSVPDAAASLQDAIVRALVPKTMQWALEAEVQGVSLVGGVAANLAIREALAQECRREGLTFHAPPISLCTDNAAMIGLAASARLAAGERHGLDLDASPNAPLPGLA